MRRRNKRRIVLIFFLILITAMLVGIFIFYKTNREAWNQKTKTPLAYMEYMGSNMIFDKEGYVISSVSTPPTDLPLVMGLDFEYVVVDEYLPIEDNELFMLCIEISNKLAEAELEIDQIELNNNDEIFLYIGEVTVELGTKKDFEKKLENLKKVATSLKKYTAGVLDMREYNEKGEYTFTTKN